MRSIVLLVLACLATRSAAIIASYPFCPTGDMTNLVTQFCDSTCVNGVFKSKTCNCSPNAARSLCNTNTGKCEFDNTCAVGSTYLLNSNLFGFIGDLEGDLYPTAKTLQQCACACKGIPECQGFAFLAAGLLVGSEPQCYLGAFKNGQTPLTPCLLPMGLNLNAFLGLTLGFKKTSINVSQVQNCNLPNLLFSYIGYLGGGLP